MSTGNDNGKVRSASNTPLRRIPSVSAAPIEPMRLSATVPTATQITMPGTEAPGAPSGAMSARGAPVRSQWVTVFASMSQVRGCPERLYCSRVPSWASSRKRNSSARSDASNAATHSTPGATSRSRESSGETARGNSVVTMAKNASGCTSCPRLRKASFRSRNSTRRAASSIEAGAGGPRPASPASAAGSPVTAVTLLNCQLQPLHPLARDRQILVSRREHQAAAGQLLLDEGAHQLLAGGIEIGRRFIEQPQRHQRQRQSRKGHAPFLPGRERTNRPVAPGARAHPLQRPLEEGMGQASPHAEPVAQVLERAQVRLQRRLVPDIHESGVEGGEVLAHIASVPEDPSGFCI